VRRPLAYLYRRFEAITHPWCLTRWNRRGLRPFMIVCPQMTDWPPYAWRTQAPGHGAWNLTLFNTKLPNVWRDVSFGLGHGQNWGWYFVWTPGTYHLIGWYDLPSSIGPPQRQAALLWIIAHLVYYGLQPSRRLSLNDCMDFMRRARWKAHRRSYKRPNTGTYLDLLWSPHLGARFEERQPEWRDQPECMARPGSLAYHMPHATVKTVLLPLVSLFWQCTKQIAKYIQWQMVIKGRFIKRIPPVAR
jgi:hypothetical protein